MRKKIVAFGLVLALGLVGNVNVASAKSINTDAYGKFTYSITKSGKEISAMTKVEKKADKLVTKLTVQDNKIGKTLLNVSNATKNSKKCITGRIINDSPNTLAAFSAHEARGKVTVVKYCSTTF